jgi:Ca-activated chloride channel family protein
MTLPLLGPMTLSGFAHPWFFLFALLILGLVALYIIAQVARQRRMLRFANMELLESVAPKQPTRWRHLSAILLVAALLLFTIAMAGPTHDVRIPRNRAVVMLVIDVSQSMRATDVEPNRMAAAEVAAKEFAGELTPGINLGLMPTRVRRPSWSSRRPIGTRPKPHWTSCSSRTGPPPGRASSPRCRPSPPSAR